MPGLNLTIELADTNGLMRQFAAHASILTNELKTAERAGLAALRDEAKRETAQFSTVLPQSVQFEIGGGGLTGIVGSVAKTALSIAQGRKAGNAPSTEAVMRWLRNRGGTFNIQTRRRTSHRSGGRLGKALAASEASQMHDEAVVIQAAIRRTGTKGLPFILPAARASQTSVTRFFSDAINRALTRLAGK